MVSISLSILTRKTELTKNTKTAGSGYTSAYLVFFKISDKNTAWD